VNEQIAVRVAHPRNGMPWGLGTVPAGVLVLSSRAAQDSATKFAGMESGCSGSP
jgi:hypothetical protein